MKKALIPLILSVITMLPASAQEGRRPPMQLWRDGGIVVNDSLGNTVQQRAKITRTSFSEFIMVFEDGREGNTDLYMQKLDQEGNRRWETRGLPVSRAQNEQVYPVIASDGRGGAFIAWQDNRNNNFDIYVQRVNSNGEPMFRRDGIPVSEAPEGQVFPEMAEDGEGGIIIAWTDYRNGNEDIYAQRVDMNGNMLWKKDGVPVCAERSTQWYPKLAPDGRGGAFITWSDRRVGDYDIYIQHLNGEGVPSWKENGVPACARDGNQERPKVIACGGGGAIVSWSDSRAGAPGVYVQRIRPDGRPAFAENGVRAASSFPSAADPEMTGDGEGGAIVVWSDDRAGDNDVYMQRIGGNGRLMWGEEPRPVVKRRGGQENPRIAGTGTFFVVWEDLRGPVKQLYYQKINKEAFLFLDYEGVLLADMQRNAQRADIVMGENGSAVVCYQDDRKGNFDIYAQKINGTGGREWGRYGKLVNDALGSVVQQNFKAASDRNDAVYFAWEDHRAGASNIHVQKVRPNGILAWGTEGIPAHEVRAEQRNPDVVPDGNGGMFVSWEDHREPSGQRIYLQHFNQAGRPSWPGGVALTRRNGSADQKGAKVVADGTGGAVVVFTDIKNVYRESDVFAQRVSADGKLMWGDNALVVCSAAGNQEEPRVAPGSLIIAWTDYRNGERNSDIYAQRIDLSGKVLWEANGVPVCEAPDAQREVAVADDKEGGSIIAWTDRGGGNYDIYAQRIGPRGDIMWVKDGVAVCQAGRTQQRPKMVVTRPGEAFIVWEDFRYGTWDIFGQLMTGRGQLRACPGAQIGEMNLMISSGPGTRYSPDVIALENSIIAAWEDYRSGSAYNIYLQGFTLGCDPVWQKNGLLVRETVPGARLPQLIKCRENEFVLAWEDHRMGGRAIMAQKFRF